MLNQNQSKDLFSHKVRVRACGILIEENKVLLLKHDSIGAAGYLWAPPGGGVEFGESLEECLKKEFMEETNLHIKVGNYLFTNEFIGTKHHAIEIFFKVKRISGELSLGIDPELDTNKQILKEAKFFDPKELASIPDNAIHNAFHTAKSLDKIEDLKGLLTFKYL